MTPDPRRARRLRVALGLGAAAALSAFAAAPAPADVISFDHAAVRIESLGYAIEIVTPADPLEINNVSYGPGDSFASSAAEDFDFAQYSGTSGGVSFSVDLAPLAAVSGSFDPATGAMTTDAVNYTTTVTLTAPEVATCTYTTSFAFSSQNAEFLPGDPFDVATFPPAHGAIADVWSGVASDPDEECAQINGYANGTGAFWFSNGIEVPKPVGHKGPPPTCQTGLKNTKRCVCKKKGRALKKGKCVKRKRKKNGRAKPRP